MTWRQATKAGPVTKRKMRVSSWPAALVALAMVAGCGTGDTEASDPEVSAIDPSDAPAGREAGLAELGAPYPRGDNLANTVSQEAGTRIRSLHFETADGMGKVLAHYTASARKIGATETLARDFGGGTMRIYRAGGHEVATLTILVQEDGSDVYLTITTDTAGNEETSGEQHVS